MYTQLFIKNFEQKQVQETDFEAKTISGSTSQKL